MVKLEIILYKLYEEEAVFYAGGIIEGCIKFHLSKEKVCKSLRIKLHGCTSVNLGSKNYEDTEILNERMELLKEGPITLPAGGYNFPFRFEIPFRLPQSIEGEVCCGPTAGMHEYRCSAALDDSSLFDSRSEVIFILKRCDYSNYYPKLCEPITKDVTNSWIFNRSSLLSMSVTLPHGGMAISEVVPIAITFDNKSRKDLENTKIKLRETVIVDKKRFKSVVVDKTVFKDQVATPVRVNDSETFTYDLKIPESMKISDFMFSDKIKVMHSLVIKAGDAELFIPIVIGSKRAEASANPQDILPSDNEILEKYLEQTRFFSKIVAYMCQ